MGGQHSNIEMIPHDLELEENIALHQKGWIIQRVGWTILYAILLLALLGLFGTGLLSFRHEQVNGHEVSYEYFLRFESEADMTFQFHDIRDTIRLTVPQSYREYIDISSISPLPARSLLVDGQVIYFFPATHNGKIQCTIMARKAGTIRATLLVNESPITITHLIYP